MKKVLSSNLGLKILAVLVSCIIWIFVVNQDDPEKTKFFDVAVEIRNSDSFGMDKTFSVEEDTDKVRVWVKARESVLNSIQSKDFKVVADMRNVTMANSVPFTVECSNNAINRANWECEPASLKIKIEDVVQESFGVEVETSGKAANGYEVGTIEIEEGDTINIAGAQSLVGIIHKVSVKVSVPSGASDSDESQRRSGSIIITDRNGTEFTKSQMDNLILTTASGTLIRDGKLNVKINLWEVRRDIRLDVGTSGKPAHGYRISNVKVTPEQISLAGDEETLAELNGVLALPDMVSVEGASESFTAETINLADFLKENYNGRLKLESGAASTISIRVTVEKVGTKKIDIPLSALTIKGRPTNLDMVLTPADKLSVEVGAINGSLSEVSQKDVRAVLDLTAYQKPGRYEVPVQITLPEGYELTSEVKMVVNLTEKAEAEDTTAFTSDGE